MRTSGWVAVLSLLAAGCNHADLAAGGADEPTPCAATADGGVVGQAVSAPGDAVPADASALLTAMDVPVETTGAGLVTTPKQTAAFAGLGTLLPTKGVNFAFLSSGVAGAGTTKSLDP